MLKVTLPGTELSISRLSFGTASLHHRLTSRARQRLLRAAFDSGILHFDTSPYYGYGLAEHELGLLRKDRGDAITVATKVGLYPPDAGSPGTLSIWARQALGRLVPRISAPLIDWSLDAARRSLETSLRRLRTDRIDVLFLHEPNPDLVASDEFLRWLEAEKGKGKVRYWGLAGHAEPMRAWLRDKHPLGAVLQVKDTLDRREAEVVIRHGRELQFTYGYFSSLALRGEVRPDSVLDALRRNRTGSVIFSTRSAERLRSLPSVLNGDPDGR